MQGTPFEVFAVVRHNRHVRIVEVSEVMMAVFDVIQRPASHFKHADQLSGCDRGESWTQAATLTLSVHGTDSPWALKASRYPSIASVIAAIASSRVSPSEMQPGNAGAYTV